MCFSACRLLNSLCFAVLAREPVDTDRRRPKELLGWLACAMTRGIAPPPPPHRRPRMETLFFFDGNGLGHGEWSVRRSDCHLSEEIVYVMNLLL